MNTYALLTRLGDEAAQNSDHVITAGGHTRTEVSGATEWPRYKELINQLEPDVVEATHL